MPYERTQRPPRDANWLPRKEYLALKMRSAMMGTSPKELLANKFLGYDPAEVRQKGVTGTMTSTVMRALLGIRPPMAQVAETIAEEPEQETKRPDSSKYVRRLMRENLRATEKMHEVLKKILNEAVIIRKVTEGRVKFNPRSGGYTRELTTKEINKRAKAGLKGPTTSFMSINDLLTPAATKAKPAAKPWERKEDENNENKDRETGIKEPVKASFGTSGIDADSADRLEESPEQTSQSTPSSGGVGGTVAGLASGLLSSLFARGVLRRGAQQAATRGAVRVGTRVGARVAARNLTKAALKKIPVIGLLAGVGFGINRMMRGDMLGAAGELASGAASTIPGAGTAASIGIDAALIARDMRRDQATAEIERSIPDTATGLEQDPTQIVAQAPPVQQVVNNINNTAGGNTKIAIPDVRPTNNSFIRFQDSRQVRVL